MELPAGGTLDGPLIFVWRNEPTVTIGRHQNPWKECNVAKLDEHGRTAAYYHWRGFRAYIFSDRFSQNLEQISAILSHSSEI